jgi:hypothetical protein
VKKLHHPIAFAQVDTERDFSTLLAANGGSTAIYDAIKQGVMDLRTTHRLQTKQRNCVPVYEHLIITDGSDNSSSCCLEEVAALVAAPGLPNYHLIVIAVGISERAAEAMKTLCKPQHAQFLLADDLAGLTVLLQRVATRIRLQLDVRQEGKNKSRLQVVWQGHQGNVREGILSVAQHAPALVRSHQKQLAHLMKTMNLLT